MPGWIGHNINPPQPPKKNSVPMKHNSVEEKKTHKPKIKTNPPQKPKLNT